MKIDVAAKDSATSIEQGPIDAVVTWVDGSDPAHVRRRKAAEERLRFSLMAIPGGRHSTRFASSGELALCLMGIRAFCPWVRKIHLVTDRQRPSFLDRPPFNAFDIEVVDHSEIFRGHEDVLPTFNSQSIETALHTIRSLADRFVYFNDDVIVLKPTGPDEFFRPGRVVLRGKWAALPRFGEARVLLSVVGNHFFDKVLRRVRSMAVLAQYRGAQLAGAKGRLLLAPHVPHPLRKATLARFFAENERAFASNIAFPFRDMRQFAPIPLANHLELRDGRAVVLDDDDHLAICFNRDALGAIDRKIERLSRGGARFLCLQGLENADATRREALAGALARAGLTLPAA